MQEMKDKLSQATDAAELQRLMVAMMSQMPEYLQLPARQQLPLKDISMTKLNSSNPAVNPKPLPPKPQRQQQRSAPTRSVTAVTSAAAAKAAGAAARTELMGLVG
jgi:hypothetical protein